MHLEETMEAKRLVNCRLVRVSWVVLLLSLFCLLGLPEPLRTFSCTGWLGQISVSDKFSHPYRGSLHLSINSTLFITTVTLPLLTGRILIFSSSLNLPCLYIPACLHSASWLSCFCSKFQPVLILIHFRYSCLGSNDWHFARCSCKVDTFSSEN